MRRSPKSVGFIVWGPWISVHNVVPVHLIVVEIFQSAPKWLCHPKSHAATMAKGKDCDTVTSVRLLSDVSSTNLSGQPIECCRLCALIALRSVCAQGASLFSISITPALDTTFSVPFVFKCIHLPAHCLLFLHPVASRAMMRLILRLYYCLSGFICLLECCCSRVTEWIQVADNKTTRH